jgi:hypothetical protein
VVGPRCHTCIILPRAVAYCCSSAPAGNGTLQLVDHVVSLSLQDLQTRLSLDMAAAAKAIRRSKVLTVHGTSEWLLRSYHMRSHNLRVGCWFLRMDVTPHQATSVRFSCVCWFRQVMDTHPTQQSRCHTTALSAIAVKLQLTDLATSPGAP